MEHELRTDPQALLEHAGWMRALAVGLLGDPGAADDVVQDTTLAALRHAPRDPAALAPWLARVLRNFARRARRSALRRADHEARAEERALEPTPSETLERLDLQRTLVEAVSAIDEPLRTTIVLRYFEGCSSAQIARTLGVPDGTVRWRLKRGLDELRIRLDARFGSRASWALLFAPLAHAPRVAHAPLGAAEPGVAAASTKTLAGVLAMNAAQVGLTAATLALVGGVVWWGVSRSPVAPDGTPNATALATSDAPAPALQATAQAIRPALADAASDPARVAASSTPASVAQVSVPDTTQRNARVDVRFVDEQGVPWSGVRLAARPIAWMPKWNPVESAQSDALGQAELQLALPSTRKDPDGVPELNVQLVATRTGCATVLHSATLRAGETTHLGDVVLGAGVSLHGRAIDEHGDGVAQATIGVATLAPPADEDRARRHGCDAFSPVPCAVSAADGRFVLDGVTPGDLRIWAHADGRRYAWSAPLTLQRERDAQGFEIVLMPLLASDRIEGRVVGRNDEPIAHAWMNYSERSRGSGRGSSTPVDEQGRFALLVEHEDSSYDFTAQDPQHMYAETLVPAVKPGALDLVIRLHEQRLLALHVHGIDGAAVERATFDVTARGFGHMEPSTSSTAGQYSIAVPEGKFELIVAAPGFRSSRMQKLDASLLPATLDVALQRAPVVRGRVLADGLPLAKARVHLVRDDPDLIGTVAGYRYRYNVWHGDLGVLTDGDGRFELGCDEDHGFWLRASADGWVAGEAGPLDAAHLDEALQHDIVLTHGGAIEGRVVLPDGRSGEGSVLAFNHGDGVPRTLRAGEQGKFRIDGLTPGAWQVLSATSEIDPNSTKYASVESAVPMEWSCNVRAGETTHFDLDLTQR